MAEAADQPDEKVEEAGELDGDTSAPESQDGKGKGDRWKEEGIYSLSRPSTPSVNPTIHG